MSDGEVTHYRWADMAKEELTPLIQRRLVTGERLMLAHVYLAEGAIVPRHTHENEQLTYILEGTLRFWLGDDEARVLEHPQVLHHTEARHLQLRLELGQRAAVTREEPVEQEATRLVGERLEHTVVVGHHSRICG